MLLPATTRYSPPTTETQTLSAPVPTCPTPSAPAQTPETISPPREIPASVKSSCIPISASDASHAASRDTKHTPPRTVEFLAGPFAGSTKSGSAQDRTTQTAAAIRACSSPGAAFPIHRQKNACSIHRKVHLGRTAVPLHAAPPDALARAASPARVPASCGILHTRDTAPPAPAACAGDKSCKATAPQRLLEPQVARAATNPKIARSSAHRGVESSAPGSRTGKTPHENPAAAPRTQSW